MHRLIEFLKSLEYKDLIKIKQGLNNGNYDIKKAVQEKIEELENKHAKICTTCSNSLDPYNSNNYTIIFGPDDFRKKASFCGLDCVEYFLIKLKQIKKDNVKSNLSRNLI